VLVVVLLDEDMDVVLLDEEVLEDFIEVVNATAPTAIITTTTTTAITAVVETPRLVRMKVADVGFFI